MIYDIYNYIYEWMNSPDGMISSAGGSPYIYIGFLMPEPAEKPSLHYIYIYINYT